MIIGANPTENHPVAATFFKQAAKRGAKLIVVDPRGVAMREYATHMLQFKPGSDVALLNAIMHVIVEEKLYDVQYLQAYTDDFEDLKKHVASYSPKLVAAICGIDARTIRTVAQHVWTRRTRDDLLGHGNLAARAWHQQRALPDRACVDVRPDRPAGHWPSSATRPEQRARSVRRGPDPHVLSRLRGCREPGHPQEVRALWETKLSKKPGLTVVEIINAANAGEIRGMYIMGENPAMSDPDLDHARAGLAKLEHMVVQDIFLTETAMMADVVLPSSAWPEKSGTVTNTNRQVQMGRKALDLPGDTRQDLWITVELGKRLGLAWTYGHPSEVFAEMKLAMPSLDNITWERLERESSIMYPCPAPDHPGEAIVFGDGFPTKTGRARIVPADISPARRGPR